MKTAFCSTLVALVVMFATGNSTEPAPAAQFAQQIHNATFMERTPDFTDLYVIQTPDKGRLITIYCNASHCYKRRGFTVNVQGFQNIQTMAAAVPGCRNNIGQEASIFVALNVSGR